MRGDNYLINGTQSQTSHQVKARLVILFCMSLIMGFISFFVSFHDHMSTIDLHTALELGGSFIALLAGMSFLMNFYALGSRFALVIGTGFVIAGFVDFIHGFYASPTLRPILGWPSHLDHQITVLTYLFGRLAFCFVMIISLFFRGRIEDRQARKRLIVLSTFISLLSVAVVVLVGVAYQFPRMIHPNLLIPRPVDFVIACGLIFISILFLKEYINSREDMVWWFMASLLVASLGQFTISFSRAFDVEVQTDLLFDVGHVYKIISYLLPMIGFMSYQFNLISYRLQAEKTARKAQEDWEKTFDSVPDLIAVIDNSHTIVRANKAMTDRLGIPAGKADGKRCYTVVHDADCPVAECPHQQLLEDNKEHSSEIVIDKLGGDFLVTCSPLLDDEGQLVGSVHVARDITKLKQTEKYLQFLSLIVEQVGECVIATDLDINMIYVNKSTELRYGYTMNELFGRNPAILNAEDEAADIQADIVKKVRKGKVWTGEHRNITKFGEIFPCEHIVFPIVNSDNEPFAYVGLMRDITDRRDAEEALRKSNKELEEFTYVASHDLQEPLRKINSFGTLLSTSLGETLDEDQQRYLNYMLDGSIRMQQLIDDLLALSRIQRARLPKQQVNLVATAQKAVEDLGERITDTNADVQIDELPVITGYNSLIVRLFTNIISNALKYRKPDSPPAIRIYLEGDKRIVVEDNGIGFDEKYKHEIFGAFKRLHSPSKYPGSGIGLAICSKIVQRHNGEIGAESKPGRGSKFWFTLGEPND